MEPEILGLVSSLAGVTVGGGISYLLQRNLLRHQYEDRRAENRVYGRADGQILFGTQVVHRPLL